MTLEEASGPPVEIFPSNLQTVDTFLKMMTQWVPVPSGGFVGLNYASLREIWELVGVRKRDRAVVFDGLQVMEEAALKEMRKKK